MTKESGYTGSEDQEHRKSLVILVSWTWQVSYCSSPDNLVSWTKASRLANCLSNPLIWSSGLGRRLHQRRQEAGFKASKSRLPVPFDHAQ